MEGLPEEVDSRDMNVISLCQLLVAGSLKTTAQCDPWGWENWLLPSIPSFNAWTKHYITELPLSVFYSSVQQS